MRKARRGCCACAGRGLAGGKEVEGCRCEARRRGGPRAVAPRRCSALFCLALWGCSGAAVGHWGAVSATVPDSGLRVPQHCRPRGPVAADVVIFSTHHAGNLGDLFPFGSEPTSSLLRTERLPSLLWPRLLLACLGPRAPGHWPEAAPAPGALLKPPLLWCVSSGLSKASKYPTSQIRKLRVLRVGRSLVVSNPETGVAILRRTRESSLTQGKGGNSCQAAIHDGCDVPLASSSLPHQAARWAQHKEGNHWVHRGRTVPATAGRLVCCFQISQGKIK